MADDLIYFNGIDGDSGDYLVPPRTLEEVAQVAIGDTQEPVQVQELQQWYGKYVKPGLGAKSGVNTDKLDQAGWAVIFADKDKDRVPALKEALGELLAHRKAQAGDLYRELTYLDGESKADFLVRHKVGVGPADPEKLPYYMLIVGNPQAIPFDFQYQLDVVYAVGRIYFETLEEFAQYARSVVEAETGKVKVPRWATFFGVQNPGDAVTNLSANQLVKPLADWMAAGQAGWGVRTYIGDGQATKAQLTRLVGKEETPAFLFTASHGMSFSKDPELQARHQGALVCQEWPGPGAWKQPIPQDFYLAYDDVDSDARLLGLVAFHFASFGAGTPQFDDFAHRAAGRPQQIAPRPFMSRLPQRLLGHPKGGALAVVSHVDRAWEYSITWKGVDQIEVFKSMIRELAQGKTVGAAMEYFSDRYAELSTTLAPELGIIQSGLKPGFNRANLVGLWTANNDARSYVIVGDPAVRLTVSDTPDATRAQLEILRPTPHQARTPQIWFVPATSKQYDWDQAFKEGRVRWTGVSENEAQQNIRATHDGDLVIAYRSTPDRYITGLGHVAGEPFEITAEQGTRHAVEIAMDLRLEQGVTLDELRTAVPDLQHVERQRPIGWSPVTPEQWTVIRELMRFHNPGLDDKLPPPQAPAVRRIEVETPEFSGSKVAGEAAQVRFRLHNRGNTTWLGDEQIRMTGVWQPPDPNAATATTWEWTRPLHDAVPPGGAAELSDLEDRLPGEAGERQVDWTVEGVAWEPPAEPVTLSSRLTVEQPSTVQKPPTEAGAGEAQRVQVLLDQARAAEDGGNLNDALRLTIEARQILERLNDQPRLADVHNRLARLHLAQGDAQEAEAHARESVRIREALGDPKALAESLRILAQLYDQTFQTDKSVATWQRLVQLDGRDVDALLGLGGAFLATGRAQDALNAYAQAARLDTSSVAAQRGIGAALQALGNFDSQAQPPAEPGKKQYAERPEPTGDFTPVFEPSIVKPLVALQGHSGPVRVAAFSPAGDRIATGGDDGTARVWDAATGQELSRLVGHTGPVLAVAWSPDGQRLFSVEQSEEFRLWDARAGSLLVASKISLDGDTTTLLPVDSTGQVTSSLEGVQLWPSAQAELDHFRIRTQLPVEGQGITALSRDNSLAFGQNQDGTEGGIISWGTGNAQVLQIPAGLVHAAAFSPAGDRLITGGGAGVARIWDTATGQELQQLAGHEGPVSTVAFGPAGVHAFTVDSTSVLRAWDTTTGLEIQRFDGHTGHVNAVVYSLAGDRMVSASDDGTALVWESGPAAETAPVLEATIQAPADESTAAGATPDAGAAPPDKAPSEGAYEEQLAGLEAGEKAPGQSPLEGAYEEQLAEHEAHEEAPAEPEAHAAPPAEEPLAAEPAPPPPLRPISTDELAQLRLDAAVPPRVQVGAPFDLAVSVRLPGQPALPAEALAQVGPGAGEIEQPEEAPSVLLRAEVTAAQCEIDGEPQTPFSLPRLGKLPVLHFRLTPKVAGDIGIVVRVFEGDKLLGSASVQTTAEEQEVGQVEPAVHSEPVRPGALDLNRKPPPPPREFDILDEDRKTTATVVYNNVWQSFVQSAERDRGTFATRMLDVNIQPHYDNQVAEADRLLNASQEESAGRRYWVVLTLQEREDGRSAAPRYFEGPLKLDAFRSEFGGRERGDFRYGQALFDTLFHADLPDNERRLTRGEPGSPTLLAGYISALSSMSQVPLRIQLRIDSKAVELHNYQWEYLWDTATGARPEPMACSELTPLSRVLQVSGPGGQLTPRIDRQAKLRILAAMASPEELNPGWAQPRTPETAGLQPIERAELEALAKGLDRFELIEKLQGRNVLDGSREPVTLEALEERLREASLAENRPFHVLHLLCHGLIGADNRSYVVLERPAGGLAAMVPEDLFAERIGRYVDPLDSHSQPRPGLRLVVLASCFTAKTTQGNSLRGVARRLVEAGVPAVVAMQQDFQYEGAQYFSQRLYAHLIYHGEVDRAVNAARRDLWDHRQRGPRDRDNPLRPDEWGVPVLFMRLADGKLFTVDPQASQLTDPDAPAEITPYAATPSGDPERLLQTTLRAAAGQMGLNVGLDALGLARAIGEAMATVSLRPAAAAVPVPQDVRLFGGEAEKRLRWALVKAANDHRCHEARRTVLFLRSLARQRVAGLVKPSELARLTQEPTLRVEIWEGGYVELNGQRLSQAVVGAGPKDTLVDDAGNAVNPASTLWRHAHRPPRPPLPGQPVDQFARRGNLVWPDAGHPYPNAPVDLPAWRAAVRDLLPGSGDNRYADRFKAFDAAVALKLPGLDQEIASLLLHAVAPDDYVPYTQPLAQAVLDVIWPQGGSGYDFSFASFCKLARDLLADDELGFESLADVAYFFQRLAAGHILWQPSDDYPKDCLPPLIEPARLDHGRLDSSLVVRESVLTQSVAALNIGKHVILTGPPGTGKTTLAEDICRHARDLGHCHGHILVTATADWTTSDTIGGYMPEADNRLVFRPGIFLEAIRAGKWLVIDEINRADIDKSFGELFTVLSGQAVTLPYTLNGRPVRILPAGWPASDSPGDYVIHRNWRIIGTMNVYDKASLFAMSYAFMRRFAFVEVPIPDEAAYAQLLERFLGEFGIADLPQPAKTLLLRIFDSSEAANNPLMRWRALGPAIARDLIGYLSRRVTQATSLDTLHLAEALSLYVVPQFDGLERDNIREIYDQLNQDFRTQADGDDLLERIRELFPYVRDWPLRPWKQGL